MGNFDINNWYWKLHDGRIWSTSSADFVPASEAQDWAASRGMDSIPLSPVDAYGEHSLEGLRQGIIFYGADLGALTTQAERDAARAQDIVALLAEIDAKSARPLRAVVAGTATDVDRAALDDLESRAEALRGERARLVAEGGV